MKYLIGILRALIAIIVAVFVWKVITGIGIPLSRWHSAIIRIADIAAAFIITSIIPVKRGWLAGMVFVFIVFIILPLCSMTISQRWLDYFRDLFTMANSYISIALELIAGAIGGYLGEGFRRHFSGNAATQRDPIQ